MTKTPSMSRRLSAAARLGCAGAVVLSVFALSGCEDVKSNLGFTRESPDEFTVLSRAPLSVPPDFNLRPPQPGASRPQEGDTQAQARAALIGQPVNPRVYERNLAADTSVTEGEKRLLTLAGASQADPNIRTIVDAETSQLSREYQSFTDRLVFWEDRTYKGTQVDAKAESKRLRENMALGRALTEGQTPTIERKKKGLLEGIF